jgi:dipeptidyl aminopeptidase/acylaminoacyl peptidase
MVEQKSVINRRGKDYPEALLVGGDIRELREQARQASPVTWVTADDAPFLTAHGTEDSTVPYAQAEEIDAALRKAGVASCLIPMQGAGHGFDHPELRRRITTFLDHHLHGKEAEPSPDPIRPPR